MHDEKVSCYNKGKMAASLQCASNPGDGVGGGLTLPRSKVMGSFPVA